MGGWCRRCGQPAEKERSNLGAPGASGEALRGKGTGAGCQGDAPVGFGGAAVQEEVGGGFSGVPAPRGPQAGIRAIRETRAPGKTENLEAGPLTTWRISPYSRARKSRVTQRGKTLSPPVEMCSARNPS